MLPITLLAAAEPPSAPVLLAVLAVGVISAGATGFAIGFTLGRRDPLDSLIKSTKKLAALYELAIKRLETARAACDAIAKEDAAAPGSSVIERFEQARENLMNSMSHAAERFGAETSPETADLATTDGPLAVEWQASTAEDSGTVPSREDFDVNLELLVEACEISRGEGGVLLVRIDRAAQLERRLGGEGVESMLKQLGRVLVRSIRECDLVCRYSDETFGVLFGGLDPGEGPALVRAIRDSVKHHTFRQQADGPEVFVTASFGFSPCRTGENAGLVLDRAGDALARSTRRGRNQLHWHDGTRTVHATLQD